jgi:tripartite-type tricarboxylate transporter receptor subunit TctC
MANPNVILTTLFLGLQIGVSQVALAQGSYPSRAITIINPFPPGGTSDIVTRPLAAALEPIVKQAVVVETKAGAAGAVGAQFVATAAPDGYTLLSHITSLSGFAEVDKLFGRKPKFTRADFIPIARFTADPMVVIVNQQQPYKTLKEFIADAKARPHEIIFSSSGLYGAAHIPMALLADAAGGLDLRHLPTMGAGPALTALLGNNAHIFVAPVSASLTYIKSGQVRPLATLGASRVPSLPDVPTLKELGYGIEYYVWVGLFAPRQTPNDIVSYLRDVVRRAAHTDQFKNTLANVGLDLAYLDQPDFIKFWDEDAARIETAIRQIGRVQN